jgi:hypothetical protein
VASAATPSIELYRPRAAEHTVRDDHGLAAFVEQEFRDFLTCGVWSHGFALPQ